MVSETVIFSVIGGFISIFGVIGHLYSMVFELRKQVREEMDERMGEIRAVISGIQTGLQTDRQIREDTRVATERELGKTVKYEDMRRETDRLLTEIDKRFSQRPMRN